MEDLLDKHAASPQSASRERLEELYRTAMALEWNFFDANGPVATEEEGWDAPSTSAKLEASMESTMDEAEAGASMGTIRALIASEGARTRA